ncbi:MULTISPECIES: DUF3775 domain-containing protein [Microvirga]|uniref:DUF3775 domain-containing protein n=1 Tax=Microvirga TaxID=186650 RepID=UPI0021C85690|nr:MULTISPECIES: DUF3775 domain-containing protein [unclassified Microvirga]
MADTRTKPKSIDPFFEVIADGEWNACVGVQGNALNYVDGYLEAARELIAAVIDKRLFASRDTLAMPILYNCRHALELSLKFAIDRLHRIEMIAATHPVNHDIHSHWQHLRSAGVGDAQLVRIIGELEPFVTSLAGIDEDGQELRYATNRDGGKSLGGIAIVNLPLIRHSIDAMSAILERLKNRLFDLEDERPTGTHTKECSRADLEEIARVLGDHATWCEPSFDEKKRQVMERFGLGSRKFSAAVDAIRRSRPLAAMVGLESELRYLSDDKAIAALELWAKAHPVKVYDPEDLGMDYFDRDWDKFREEARIAHELYQAVLELLTVEELADLQVLFYIGRDRIKGEHYDDHLERTIAEHQAAKTLWEGVHHLMSKTSLLDAAVDGAATVGRPSLGAKIRAIRLR